MATIWHCSAPSPIGCLYFGASESGLRWLQFSAPRTFCKGDSPVESCAPLAPYIEQIQAYFRGELRQFDCPLDLHGTDFQKRCWQALRRIPYGETCTYADLAREVGSPKSFRAVGQANHHNPVAIIVPCHRVIGADGTLTGYGGGLRVKETLLRLEGALHQPGLDLNAAD